MPRRAKKSRGIQVLTVAVAISLWLLLVYQAITDIAEGNYVTGENYLGQPVGPALRLIVCIVALVIGAVAAWQHFHRKAQPTGKKKREKPIYFKWPHEIP